MSSVQKRIDRSGNWMPLPNTNGRHYAFISVVGMVLMFAGCNTSGLYPVTGAITDSAGNPIAGLEKSNYVMFAQVDGISSSMGDIQADGSFRLFTNKPGDGVPPGDYYVYLPRHHVDPERAMPQVISGKFENIDQLGWTKTVEKKRNHFVLEVTPARPRAGKR